MKKAVAALAFGLIAGMPAIAQEEDPWVESRVLTPEVALMMATAALNECRDRGYQIGVMVLDRHGLPQAFLRDRFAGLHTFEMAHRKAWTAISFRTDTSDLAEVSGPGEDLSGLRHLDMAMAVGGGLMVLDGEGSLVAGIGVSGAPGGTLDEECAQAGIDAIEDLIAF
jgi:uncharacterized protein GlcG (DUF336 family)